MVRLEMNMYVAARKQLQVGDIVLFSGKGRTSTAIKWITRSPWSHVGLVVLREPSVLLWESTLLGDIEDVLSGKCKQGAQLVQLSTRVQKYDGSVALRRLQVERTEEMAKQLDNTMLELGDCVFEDDNLEFLRAAYDGPLGHNAEDLSSLFCSELVAETYQRMGLLPDDTPSNEYTPKDFSEKGRLSLLRGASLGPELALKTG